MATVVDRISQEARRLPRQFWLLTMGTVVYCIGVEMCYPFETIFLNRTLGVSMTTVGLILGVTLLVGLPFQIVGGAVADRHGRRPVLVVAVCASMTLYIGLGLVRSLPLIVALFTFEAAFGWAQYLIASNAMTADLTPFERRAEAFSILRVGLNIGMVIGPLLATLLVSRDPSFTTAFVGAGVVCGLFLVMVLTMFKETRPEAAAVTAAGTGLVAVLRGYGGVLRDRRFLAFSLIALLPLYGFGQIWVTTPIMLAAVHNVSAETWGLLTSLYAGFTAVLQYPVVKALRRRDSMLLMAAASACIGVGMGACAFLPWPAPVACILVVSLGVLLLIPIATTIVAELAPPHLRGRYMGAWTIVYMGGYALGPLAGGWAMDALGPHWAFAVVAAAGLLGAALFPLLRIRPATATDELEGDDEDEEDEPTVVPPADRPPAKVC